MKRIILSLIFVMIALAGVSCASASSDFNDTAVENNLDVYEVNESTAPISDVENNTEAQAINDTGKVVENKTIDPIQQYSALYNDFKGGYSQYWFSVPIYDALRELSCVLKNKYSEADAINILAGVFCHVELGNSCDLVKTAAHQMVSDLYHQWHHDNGWQKYNQKNSKKNNYFKPKNPESNPNQLT